MDLSKTHIELVEKVYETLEDNIAKLRLRTVSYTHLRAHET